VKEDTRIGRHHVKKGSVVLVHLPAASRDPRATAGEAFCPVPESSNHLAFGHGMHRCVGAELGRMELRAAFPALARRFPDLELAVDPSELQYHEKSIVYGIEALPVQLQGGAAL
jgi:cytochrome P450